MRNDVNPHEDLRQAVRGNRILGILMIFLGADIDQQSFSNFLRHSSTESKVLIVSSSLFLIAPGILYQVAAYGLKKREQRAGRMSMYVAIGQSIPSLLASLFAFHFGARYTHALRIVGVPPYVSALLMPLLASAFFVPALLAQTWKLSRAIKAIQLLPSTGRAFEAIMVKPMEAVQGAEAAAGEDASRSASQ